MKKSEVAELLALHASVGGPEPDEAMVEGWHWLLEPYAFADAKAALRVHLLAEPGVRLAPGHLAQIIDGWDEQWVLAQRAGPRPPGGPGGAGELISGEEAARRLGMTPARPALGGGEQR